MTERPVLTRASLVGSAVQILTDGGYREIRDTKVAFWDSADTRLFEDEHGIVALVIYETWQDLASGWQYAQDNLVDLISRHMAVGEPKAWDAYLVMLTPSPVVSETELEKIRYDTRRARKIVVTGGELSTRSDVERALAPLLPISGSLLTEEGEDALSRLPRAIEETDGIPSQFVRVVVDAFLNQEPMIEKLDATRRAR